MDLISILKTPFLQGAKHPNHLGKENAVIIFNQLAFACSIIVFGIFFSLKKYDNTLLSASQLVTAIICLATPLFNRFGQYHSYRYIVLIALCVNNFIATSTLGFESGRAMLIIPVLISIFLIWQNEPFIYLALAYGIIITLIFALHYTDYSFFLDKEISMLELRKTSKNNFLALIFALSVVLFLYALMLNKKEQGIKLAQEQLKAVFDNSIDAFFLVDLKTHLIIRCNKSAVRLFEAKDEKELEGKRGKLLQKIPPSKSDYDELMKVLQSEEGVFKMQVEYTSFKGREFWGDVVITKITKNNIGGTYLVRISDITESKTMHLQQQELNKELVRHNQNLEQFSYITSHNLRAPVSSMAGVLSIFNKENFADPQNKEVIIMMERLVKNLDNVILDLNQLLTIKQLADDKKTKIYFDELLEEILVGLSTTIDKNELQIESDFSKAPVILTIRSYLYSIVNNLLSNAIKYRSPERLCKIHIETKQNHEGLLCTITDNGLGIDLAKHKEQLFGLYKRFHEQVEGKGLGLHMVKLQAEALGAEIEVESEVDKGTVFKILFKK